ncbi:MAG: Tfp pilus assembly protein FimT/FimU [Planctomycetia bacterium]
MNLLTFMNASARRRHGASMSELLVVVAIMGAVAVGVLPNVAGTVEARRSREATRTVVAFAGKAHARALGRREWSGFLVVASGSTSFAALDTQLAEQSVAYRGDTVDAAVTITGTAAQTRTATGNTGQLTASGSVGVAAGDLVRFDGRGPLFEITSASTTQVVFRLRGSEGFGATEDAGLTQHNTPWPAPSPATHTFEILRRPLPAGSPLTLADGRCIDLYWSGFGPPQVGAVAGTYRRFTTAGSTVSVLFDGTGRLRQFVEATPAATQRLTVTGPLFLLVGRAIRAEGNPAAPATFNAADDASGANWQYADSYWVAIDPETGMVKSAECMHRRADGTLVTDVIESQSLIRRLLMADGG